MAKKLFKKLSKPKQLPQFRRGRKAETDFGPIVVEEARREDPRLSELARLLGSLTVAKQVLAIQASDPQRTILECVIEWWLRKEGMNYAVQVPALGGRAFSGGTVIDAVVWVDRSRAIAIMGQGDYWHSDPQSTIDDASIKTRLKGQYAGGARLETVIEVWESTLYRNVNHVMQMAVQGFEVPR